MPGPEMKTLVLIAAVLAVTTYGQLNFLNAEKKSNEVYFAIQEVSKTAPTLFGQIPEILATFLYSKSEDFLDAKDDLLEHLSTNSGDVDKALKIGLKTAMKLIPGLSEMPIATGLADKGLAYEMTEADKQNLDGFLKLITDNKVSVEEWNLIASEFPPKNPRIQTKSQFSILEIAPKLTKELVRTFVMVTLQAYPDETDEGQEVIKVLKANTAEVDKLIKEWYKIVQGLPHFSQSTAEYKQLSTDLANNGLAYNLTREKFQVGIAYFNSFFKTGFSGNDDYFVKTWKELQEQHRVIASNSSGGTNIWASLVAFAILAVVNIL